MRNDILSRLDRTNPPYYATVFPHAHGTSHWGYALWSSPAGTATLSLQRVSEDENGWAKPRRGAVEGEGVPLLIEGGNDVDWFDIRMPAGLDGVLLARNQEGRRDWDQVLCLFTPGGEPVGCDDDSGRNFAGSGRVRGSARPCVE